MGGMLQCVVLRWGVFRGLGYTARELASVLIATDTEFKQEGDLRLER